MEVIDGRPTSAPNSGIPSPIDATSLQNTDFKVKSEVKEWFEKEAMMPDSLSSNAGHHHLKSGGDSLDMCNSYRMPLHQHMGSDSPINGPRPSPLPPGVYPFSQSPDLRSQLPQQFLQQYQNHSGLRCMSPGFQGLPRGQMQHPLHGASQGSGAPEHPGLQHLSSNQHLQHHFGQQQQMNLPGNPLQQLPSPYPQGMLGPPGMGSPGNFRGHEHREGDPYSFVDEYTGPPPRPVDEVLGHVQPKRRGRKPKHVKLLENGGDPLAIAAAQAAHEAKKRKWKQMGPDGKPLLMPMKPRKRIDRFDGITEDELTRKILPDHIGPNLDVVIISKFPFQIGINPGLFAAFKGHHYAGPGNHFWKCLYLSGLIPEPLTSDDDRQLLDYGIGFTNIVSRTTRGSSELTRKEIKEGGQILLAKLQRFQPRIAVFNGKGIYEIFSSKKEFNFGRQPERIEGTRTHVWVMPSSSARCAQLPRALDKVPFYTALRKFRDFLKGTIPELTEEEITFSAPKGGAKHLLKDCDKLSDLHLEDDLTDPFMDDPLKDDPDGSRFECDLDSEEISRSISQSLYNLSGMTMEQLEALECPTIPIRKKRGRPKKAQDDPNAPMRPKARSYPTEYLLSNGEEPPRKKRGRPKKVLEDGTIAPPKRAGRKPKALKEMLASQPSVVGPHMLNPHSEMDPINDMMSPTGYNDGSGLPPFSPQYGGPQVHHLNGPHHSDIMHPHLGVGISNPPHVSTGHPSYPGSRNSIHSNHPILSVNSLHQHGCPTPTSSTPQGYNQPGYSPSPVANPMNRIGTGYSQRPENTELQMEEERQLGLSSLPASPVMAQPDFEPPTSLPESENLIGEPRSALLSSHQDDTALPSIQSQFSDSSTVPEEAGTPYSNYPTYPSSTTCPNTTFVSNATASPSYPPSVSCSPSYTQHQNTHSPSYPPNSVQSPSYPHNITQSPSYPTSSSQSPSYPPPANQSPSFTPVTQSPSFASNTQSPSYSTLTRSPPYQANLTHSPSYRPLSTQSPSYRPPMSQSPSFPSPNPNQSPFASSHTQSPLNKPIQSPQMKNDVASKSLSGLESLVDQIPSLNESEPGPALVNGPCSNSTTPGPSNPNDQFSPSHCTQNSSFSNFPGVGPQFPTRYGSPQASNYSPQNTATSTNFSVTSLATSSSSLPNSHSYDSANCSSTPSTTSANNTSTSSSVSISVSQLTRATPTPTNSMYANSYSPAPTGPSPHPFDMMGPSVLPPTPPMGPTYLSSGMGNSLGPLPPSMNMGSQLPYPYSQYSESPPSGYPGSNHPSTFPYASSPGFPVSSPRFSYPPHPYANGPYSQGYSQNAMLERIKQTGMGMGFGGF